MRLTRFSVSNYKCFHQDTCVELQPGFNVALGQNNAGKTALLEAMSLNFRPNPHKSAATVPVPNTPPKPTTRVCLEFSIASDELQHFLATPQTYFFPLPAFPASTAVSTSGQDSSPELREFVSKLLTSSALRITATFVNHPNEQWTVPSTWYYETANLPTQDTSRPVIAYRVNTDGSIDVYYAQAPPAMDIRNILAGTLRDRLFRFTAQSVNRGTCRFGTNRELQRDGGNLAEVLATLQPDVGRFAQLNELLQQILPSIHAASVELFDLGSDRNARILIWSHGRNRRDLAYSLDECGSGVGQVLAILYVVLTSEFPRTILLDEPQSFLHPGAARKLLEVLQAFPQHQFIVATHSPMVIDATRASALFIVRKQGATSEVVPIAPKKAEDARLCLAEVGASFADVFGADNILWVEGATEQRCFPRILQHFEIATLRGVAIEGVIKPGDFQGSKAQLTLDVYRRLSGATYFVAPTLGFIFDDECRTEQEKNELCTRGDHKVYFLPRRMYENYLLHAEALACVLNEADPQRSTRIEPYQISAWLDDQLEGPEYNGRVHQAHRGDECWVRADLLLNRLFNEFTDTRVTYRKTTHSLAITEILLAEYPEHLRGIADFLRDTLQELHSAGLRAATAAGGVTYREYPPYWPILWDHEVCLGPKLASRTG